MNSSPRLLVLAALAFFLFGCEGNVPFERTPGGARGPAPKAQILIPQTLEAGTSTPLPCEHPEVLPARGWRVSDSSISFERAGTYRWSCKTLGSAGELTVNPSKATTLLWSPVPPSVTELGSSMQLAVHQIDRFGNEVEALKIQVHPPESARDERDRVRFILPGKLRLDAINTAGEILESKTLRVDSGPPEIKILTPARGTIVSKEKTKVITLQGHVEEDGPILHMTVNDQVVSVDANGIFNFTLRPRTDGLQVFTFRASDELSQVTTGAHAVLYGSPRIPGALLKSAGRVFLPASFLDDDDHHLDDLARAVEVMLGALKIPDSKVSLGCGGRLSLSNIRWSPGNVAIVPSKGGLKVGVELRDISVNFKGKACLCAWGSSMGCAPFEGRVSTAGASAMVKTLLGVSSPTAVAIEHVDLKIKPLKIHWSLFSGSLDWFVDFFEDSVRSFLESSIEAALRDRVSADLGLLLDQLLPPQKLKLPKPIDQTLEIKATLEQLVATEAGLVVDAGLRLVKQRIVGKVPPATQTLRASGALPELPNDRLGIAVALDVLNDAIFQLYRQGVLTDALIDWRALGLLPPPGVRSLRISAMLPPILLPGNDPGQLRLSVGDLKMQATLPVIGNIEVFVSFSMSVEVSFDAKKNEVLFTLEEDDFELYFAPASPEDARTLSSSVLDLEALARRIILEALSKQVLRLKVPIMDLNKIKGISAFRGKQIGFKDADLTITPEGFIIATARVSAVTPKSP